METQNDTHIQCCKCLKIFTLDNFKFRKNKNTYYSECNNCTNKRKRNPSHDTKCRYKFLLNQAKKRNVEVNLSIEEYSKLLENNCHYCDKNLPKFGCSLDRIDNNLGYEIKNVVPCCARCNTTRNENFTYKEMKVLSKTIVKLDQLKDYKDNITRPYSTDAVEKLRCSLTTDYNIAYTTSVKLRKALHQEPYIHALGCLTGMQAVQCAKAGLKSIYVSGWQIAADQNLSGETYPDQSLYPCNSGPNLVKRINKAFERADQIEQSEGCSKTNYWLPIIADCEASFGGPLNAFELTKAMIEAGAAGIHFEDQLSSAKKCGHLGGKVLIPASHFIKTLIAARLAADIMNVPTVIIARTDADSAKLLTSDIDDIDRPYVKGTRTEEGFYDITGGLDMAIIRGLAYAPYADLIWCETSHPDLEEATKFAQGIHAKYPGKLLAYNCFDKTVQFITSCGVKSFSDFKNNDSVTVLTHKNQWKTASVKCYGNQFLNRIIFSKGKKNVKKHEVLATANHRWILSDNTITSNLKVGDKVTSPWIVEFIEENYKESDVWCLEVEDDHSFVLPNGIATGNCSPSFHWKKDLNKNQVFNFQKELGAMGYKFQFITLAGFHVLNQSMFELAIEYRRRDMEAYVDLQEKEFALQEDGYSAVKHQREVGVGYFDMVMETIGLSLTALKESTEKAQF